MDSLVLSIDCGTQSLRALLFYPDGTLFAKKQIQYDPYVSPKPGWAEQDPEIFWQSLCQATQALKRDYPDEFNRIRGVGVTTQRDSMVNLDATGQPLRPVITWLDQRKANMTYVPNKLLQMGLKAVGMEEALKKTQTDGKCNWIIQHQPEIWKKTHKYVQVSGFLNFRLTGQFVDSVASQIGHIPMDYKRMRWAPSYQFTSLLFPIDKKKLPEIVNPGTQLGVISFDASQQTGIHEGTPVIACGSDKGCETIGMGVLNTSMASLSFGTTATVQTTTKNYFEPIRFMPPYPAPIPGHYNPEVEIFRGYWMITWFKNEFAYKEVIEAQHLNKPVEEILNDLLYESPPGSMGLMVQPYWGPGLKHPEAKGAMIGFGDVHKKAHVYRAVIEGLGYALLDGLHSIEQSGKCKVKKVTVSGGASQSDAICQITSDIFNLPLVRGITYETSGLGAAIVTSVGLNFYSSFSQAVEKMVHYDKEFIPNKNNVALYSELYKKVYKKMYVTLKSLYQDIRDITGYPEK
ncbi:MAG: FGGY-family carbohydrate kinase [Desulfobacterales bacterium]|nr:FGGY-family carbohydrate kinase [Desulfobacterales bacterium]